MAWLEQTPNGNYHVRFRLNGQKYQRSLSTKSKRQAEARMARLEETIELVNRGRIEIPNGRVDLVTFLLSDGKLNGKPKQQPQLTISKLFDKYLASLPPDALEHETLRIFGIHRRHFESVLGEKLPVSKLNQSTLQDYVNKRARKKGKHGKQLSPITIKKELASLRTVYLWARGNPDIPIQGEFPKLRFPKTDEKPRFQTFDEIERQLRRGGKSTEAEEADLWDCLYLRMQELEELTEFIHQTAAYSFLYPMCVMAVHTGARRSELCRSQESDVDLEAGILTIREKKRVPGKRSTRQVPISAKLREVLEHWLPKKRESVFIFPAEHKVTRNRTAIRENQDSVSVDEASEQLDATLENHQQYKHVRGWHVFRHSFASNLAAIATDARLIDQWMGHQTEEMRKRYRHLFPDVQQHAIDRLFG